MKLHELGLHESRVSDSALDVYCLLVDGLLETGQAAPGLDRSLLSELAAQDWIAVDAGGDVQVVYPFSLAETDISVEVNGRERYAMCAIDALGIAPMLSVDVLIRTTCPFSGTALEIRAGEHRVEASQPDSTVILRRRQSGAAHVSRCAATRFFRSEDDAAHWRSANGAETDVILTLPDAFEEATAIFGRCYSDGVRMVL